jgi:hypothetical protein
LIIPEIVIINQFGFDDTFIKANALLDDISAILNGVAGDFAFLRENVDNENLATSIPLRKLIDAYRKPELDSLKTISQTENDVFTELASKMTNTMNLEDLDPEAFYTENIIQKNKVVYVHSHDSTLSPTLFYSKPGLFAFNPILMNAIESKSPPKQIISASLDEIKQSIVIEIGRKLSGNQKKMAINVVDYFPLNVLPTDQTSFTIHVISGGIFSSSKILLTTVNNGEIMKFSISRGRSTKVENGVIDLLYLSLKTGSMSLLLWIIDCILSGLHTQFLQFHSLFPEQILSNFILERYS